MYKLLWLILFLMWFSALLLLIFALTDLGPDYPYDQHKYVIAIGFITITGFFKMYSTKFKRK